MSKKSKRKKLTRHHIRNRSKGGTNEVSNIISLINEKHECWNILFKNKTFLQVAKLLLRADRMKKKQDKEWENNIAY